MMNFISAIESLTFGESLIILLLGMGVIFLTLTVLIGCLYLIRYVVGLIEKPRTVAVTKEEATKVNAEIEEDEETVAAITAAITCILSEENKGSDIVAPFRIKKIKQIH